MPLFWSELHTAQKNDIAHHQKLYEGKHEVTLHSADGGWKYPIYRIDNLLGDRLTNTMSTLVWRDHPHLITSEERQQSLDQIVSDSGLLAIAPYIQHVASYAGNATLKLVRSKRTGLPRVIRWGVNIGEFAFWENERGEDEAVTFYRQEVVEYRGDKSVTVMVGERFELTGDGNVLVTNQAYRCTGDGVPDLGTPLPLLLIDEGESIKEEFVLRMNVLPACRACNIGEGFGASDYSMSLISLQKSTARLGSQRDIAIMVMEMPAMNVPMSMLL